MFVTQKSVVEKIELVTKPVGQQHPSPARTVFSKALDAVAMRWDDPQLVKIMRNESGGPVTPDSATAPYWVNEVGQMLWQEHIPTACAR